MTRRGRTLLLNWTKTGAIVGRRRLPAGTPFHVSASSDRPFPYSSVDYPAFTKKYNPRYLVKVNGVFAGTSNHTGSFPRVEVHVKDGYVKEVKGGGDYGELWREFLKYPKINELTYPFHDQPGYCGFTKPAWARIQNSLDGRMKTWKGRTLRNEIMPG